MRPPRAAERHAWGIRRLTPSSHFHSFTPRAGLPIQTSKNDPQTADESLEGSARSLRAAARWRIVRDSAGSTAIALLTTVAVLLVFDWVLFDTPALAARLPIAADRGSPNNKLLLAPRYPDAQVLYLGDSRVLYTVDPSVVSDTCACGPGFNAGFSAADPALMRIMADRLLRRLSPKLVVIGVSEWHLSDAADIKMGESASDLVPPWQMAELGASLDDQEPVDGAVGFAWRLYGYRSELRDGLEAWASKEGPEDPRRGFVEYEYEGRREVRDQDLERRERQWFTDFSVDGRRADELRGLLARLRQRGIQVLLVAHPLYPKFHDRVRREVATFRAALEALAAEQGVALEDATAPRRAGIDADHFVDVVHVDEEGAAEFSRYLGRVLRSRFAAD